MYEVTEFTPPTKRGVGGGQSNAVQNSSMIDTVGTTSIHSANDNRKNSISENVDPILTNKSPQPTGTGVPTTARTSKKGIEVQDELARIVLVGKGLMEDWRKMQETLRTEMEK